jgi:hypothetical protein
MKSIITLIFIVALCSCGNVSTFNTVTTSLDSTNVGMDLSDTSVFTTVTPVDSCIVDSL